MNTVIEKVIIIIPTYNETENIQTTIKTLFNELDHVIEFDIHVLVFDSASTDGTPEKVNELIHRYPKLHFYSEPQKTGLGSAYLKAMNYAINQLKADIVVEFDADLSHQPQYLLPMLKQMKHVDCVVGSRYIPGGQIPKNWGIHRKMLSRLGNYVARYGLISGYKDLTSGFRMTRTTCLKPILPKQFLSNQYAYKLHLFWLLHQNGAKIIEYPIVFQDRTLGNSKLPKNSIIDALRVIFILRYHAFKSTKT